MRRGRVILLIGGLLLVGATVAYAASVGLTSKRVTVLSTAAPTTTTSSTSTTSTTLPAPKASVLTFTDGGGTTGLPQAGDSLTVTYSDSMSAVSFCSSWNAGNADYSITAAGVVTVTLQDNVTADGKDRLVVSVTAAACGGDFNFGSVNLADAGFVTSTSGATFTGGVTTGTTASKIEWTHSTKQLKLTLGTKATGTVSNVNGNRVGIHTPDPDLKGANGASISSDTVSSTPTNNRLF